MPPLHLRIIGGACHGPHGPLWFTGLYGIKGVMVPTVPQQLFVLFGERSTPARNPPFARTKPSCVCAMNKQQWRRGTTMHVLCQCRPAVPQHAVPGAQQRGAAASGPGGRCDGAEMRTRGRWGRPVLPGMLVFGSVFRHMMQYWLVKSTALHAARCTATATTYMPSTPAPAAYPLPSALSIRHTRYTQQGAPEARGTTPAPPAVPI